MQQFDVARRRRSDTPVGLSIAVVVAMTVLGLAGAAATTVLVVTGHSGDVGLVAVALGPVAASLLGYSGSAKASQATSDEVAQHVQRLTNGGLDAAVRQTLDNIQTAAVGGQPNAPS